jgi:hypothetical protein
MDEYSCRWLVTNKLFTSLQLFPVDREKIIPSEERAKESSLLSTMVPMQIVSLKMTRVGYSESSLHMQKNSAYHLK